mmetsp:Transcript_38019/g.74465  ORF Transcript_38019/g.74465 Transcript_38019/m.74465 type:complete len:99 (+) Transcript_38019:145-441(+)
MEEYFVDRHDFVELETCSGVKGGEMIFDRHRDFLAGVDADQGGLWRVTGILFGTTTKGAGRKVLALASKELPLRIRAGILLNWLTMGGDGARDNGAWD